MLTLLLLVYARGWWRLNGRRGVKDQAFGVARLLSYATGMGILAVALLSPIDHYSDRLFSIHMVQHVLLLLSPLLLLLANPLPIAVWGLPGALRRNIGSLLRTRARPQRVFRALTSVRVAWPLFVVIYWMWHDPRLFQAALRHELVHDLQHVSFFLAALLFWWPVVNAAPQPFVPYRVRFLHVLLGFVQNTVLGAIITFSTRVVYTLGGTPAGISPIWDQRLGGLVMLVGMGMMHLVVLLALSYPLLTVERNRPDGRLSADPRGRF